MLTEEIWQIVEWFAEFSANLILGNAEEMLQIINNVDSVS